MPARVKGGQEEAVWRLLVRLKLRPVDVKARDDEPEPDERTVARAALGQVALALAKDLDRSEAYGRAASAKELRGIIEALTVVEEEEKPGDAHHHQLGSWDDPS